MLATARFVIMLIHFAGGIGGVLARRLRSAGASVYLAALALIALCQMGAAYAAGTPAGSTITNTATVNYTVAGSSFSQTTAAVLFRVDELISVTVTGPAAPVNVNTPDVNRVLAFTVTNTGNAPEPYNLIANLNPGAPVVDQFNPQAGSAGQLFIDVNNNGLLDIGVDTLIPGVLNTSPGVPVTVLFVSNMPSGLANGNQGVVTLTAASATPGAVVGGVGAVPGTVLPNGGTPAVGVPGIDAVIGAGRGGATDSGADDTASGTYLVGTVAVSIAKTVIAVTSPFGVTTTGCNVASPPVACSTVVPGTIIQYQLTVTIAGGGTATGVLIADDIPANTTYVAGSIRFNSAPRTDQADGDNVNCTGCGNAVGTVTVNVGDVPVVPSTPVIHVIDYKVSIN